MLSRIFLVCLICSLFYQCEQAAIFREAQPQGGEDQVNFPFYYQGNYLCTEDSTVLKIRDKHIYEEVAITFVDSLDGQGIDAMLIRETLNVGEAEQTLFYLPNEPLPLEQVLITDTYFVGRLIHRDTLFTIGTEEIVRQFKGHLLLNFERDDGNFEVVLLSRELNGDVNMSLSKMPADLEALQAITPTEITKTNYGEDQIVLQPSRRELHKIINKRMLFEQCRYFERLPDYEWMDIIL